MSRDPFPTERPTSHDSKERRPANRLGTDSVEPGDAERMNREIRRLVHQVLAAEKPFRDEPIGTRRLLVRTKKGKSLVLKPGRLSEDQAIYLAKPSEAKHDSDAPHAFESHFEGGCLPSE